MTRILISYFRSDEGLNNGILSYWDGLIQDFKNNGNEVFVINACYFNSYGSNVVKNERINAYLLTKIKEFNPELILAFNHRVPQCVLENFKDIPTIIWDGDELKYFCDLDYIKENIGKYKIFSVTKDWKKDYLNFGFNDNQYLYVPPATSITAKEVKQTMPISFLGTIHYSQPKISEILKFNTHNKNFYSIILKWLNNSDSDYVDLYNQKFQNEKTLNLEHTQLFPLFNFRLMTLMNLLDLDLTICGTNWDKIIELLPQLYCAFDSKKVFSLAENEEFYNSSIISISPIHPQARGKAFPWRIFDVMASNACLVSEQSSDLKELTKDYIDLPMFHTPYEAREICKNLLNDEKARREIVFASQKYVNENARWIHRFKDMEAFLNVKLINPEQKGTIYLLKNDLEFLELLKEKQTIQPKQQKKLKPKDKLRLKIYNHLNKILKRKGII